MRSIIILSVLLFAVAVLARKDDVACVVHSDDCGKCVSNGCNWCSDGYCVSTESDMCEASKVSTQCGAAIVKPVHKRIPTTNPCESNYKCSDCAAAGCIVCVDASSQIFKCSHDTTCQTDAYGAVFERWIDRVVPDSIASFNFQPSASNLCPPRSPPATNSPELRTAIQVVLNQFGDMPISFLEAKILGALKPIFTPPTFTAQYLSITATPSTKKRQGATVLADVRVKFADAGTITAQGIAATIIANNPATYSVSSGTITALPYLPSAGSGQAVSPTTAPTSAPESNSKGINISKGALAGIIIGCVLGGALLIAIVAWFILRRRDAYPQAFRSPAAAYRP